MVEDIGKYQVAVFVHKKGDAEFIGIIHSFIEIKAFAWQLLLGFFPEKMIVYFHTCTCNNFVILNLVYRL